MLREAIQPEALVHGHRMLLHDPARDRYVSGPLLAGFTYEPFETWLLLKSVRPGDVVLDIGANIGYYTLLLARQVGPQGKVFAFEPDPDNFALLRQNVERNGYTNVVLVQKAASDRNGKARLFRSIDNQGDHRLHPADEHRSSVEIETVRLDDHFSDASIRFALIKMDIQGAEGLALAGMRDILARSPDVKLFCELWPMGLARAGGDAANMLQVLREQGFLLHEISEARREIKATVADDLAVRYPQTEDRFTNLLCSRQAVDLVPPANQRPKVSLCMIVKNEQSTLPACLDSVADLVDEMIVIDTGSTDLTRDIARQRGARVFDFGWVDSFAAARNESLRHARGDWIFWLDADERLDADNRQRLQTLFASLKDEKAAFVMKCLCLPDHETRTTTVVDHVRLFRNDSRLRWVFRVHEQILPSLRRRGDEVRWCDVVIHHTGYQDPALRQRKLQRDLRLLHLEDAERPNHPFTLFNLGSIAVEQGRLDEALGYLRRSLELSDPRDSIVRKLYALIASCHRRLGQQDLALDACHKGRQLYPDDPELRFHQGILLREQGGRAGARACWKELLHPRATDHFASIDPGMLGWKVLHLLAQLELEEGNLAQAEHHWIEALARQPDLPPARVGLAEIHIRQRRWDDISKTIEKLQEIGLAREAELLRSRLRTAQGDQDQAA